MKGYPFKEIEKKWQKYWEENETFKAEDFSQKPKFYILDMFPYPSAEGLHVGHPEGYTATDIIARYKWMNGYNVLHPMGWDAFGLPAEQYALSKKVHPKIVVKKNIDNFRRQIKSLGLAYDWSREIDTTDPKYYKWTQWIFLKLYEKGLAYLAEVPVNWCPALKIVLANEEVENGLSKRGGYPVVKKLMKQWMLRITAYAERLLEGLNELDWPENIKEMQRNWIGRSEGAEIDFKLANFEEKIPVFTTRPDTIFGATYLVLAPEHPVVKKITTNEYKKVVNDYVEKAINKSDIERTDLLKEKTGVFTGSYAINPLNSRKIPVWIADYVLITYGTGAIMAVPAHDQRDFDFAKKFNLEIIEVVSPNGSPSKELNSAYEEDGIAINSGQWNGLPTSQFKKEIVKYLENNRLGKFAVQYKMRDWIFSRQRYWGEPIPLLYEKNSEIIPLNEESLPLILPDVEYYEPLDTGESPLAGIKKWVEVKDMKTGKILRRETNTMPQWAGSCWYYLRYIDPNNDKKIIDPEKEKYWMPVDLYIGGAEHAVMHLLYARFWHHFLYDIGIVSTKEPFKKLLNQGLILGEDGQKMSKSRGNVINPDDVIEKYGADAMRLYEMFMGPLDAVKPWSTRGIQGVKRFLDKVWTLFEKNISENEPPLYLQKLMHKTIKKVTEDIEKVKFNTAISQMMIFVNEISNEKIVYKKCLENLTLILSPFAPHISEELWEKLKNPSSIVQAKWPKYDLDLTSDEIITIVVEVNGKVRSKFQIEVNASMEELKEKSLQDKKVQKWLAGKEIKKIIVVPNKLVNIVTN